MNLDDIVFKLNIPADLRLDGRPDKYVIVSTYKVLGHTIITKFEGLDTDQVIAVKDWMALYAIAHSCSIKQWEARDNARALGNLQVTPDGNVIPNTLKS